MGWAAHGRGATDPAELPPALRHLSAPRAVRGRDAGVLSNVEMGEAEFARELNRHICAAAEQLGTGGELPVHFVCECGCMSRVTSTLAAYEASKGVWIAAHRARSA